MTPLLRPLLLAAFALAGFGPAGNVPMHVERVRSAAAFIDSIGVNVHFSYHDGPYGRVDAVEALIAKLGVRHLRDGVSLGQNDVCATDRALAARGVHMDFLVQASLTAAQLAEWAACVGPSIEAFEGLNEYDLSHPPDDAAWAVTVQRVQRDLYHNVKADPKLARLTVIGPSLTSRQAFQSVGDLSASMDVGAMHNYFGGHEPSTRGWALGGYGSIPWNLAIARLVAGSRPVDTTETGYSSGPDPKTLDATTQGIYVPVLYLEQYGAGIARTYYYELVDEGGEPFSHYGLADATLAPKPAFTSLASLVALLGSHGPARAGAGSLNFAIDGASAGDVHHLVLAAADGRTILLLWQTATSWDTGRGVPVNVADRTLTVRLGQHVSAAFVDTCDASGAFRRTDVTRSAPAIALRLGARLQALELRTGR